VGGLSRRCAFAAAIALCVGCKDDNANNSRPAGAPAPPTTEQAPLGGTSEASSASPGASTLQQAAAPATPITQQWVDALMTMWLNAQNNGEFEAYAVLYAKRFTGIKRVGARSWTMDRKRWLEDRKRMFHKPMSVLAKERHTRLQESAAGVTFEQHWASNSFQDVGTKQLTIIMEDGRPRIAREEMLNSRVLAQGAHDELFGDVYLTLSVGGNAYLLLGQAELVIKAPRLLEPSGSLPIALGPVAAPEQEQQRHWSGRQVRVVDSTGKTCTATGDELFGIVQAEPVSATGTEPWYGKNWPEQKKAQHVFDSGPAQLAVRLRSPYGECSDPVLAYELSHSTIRAARQVALPGGREAALAAVQRLPEYISQQKEFEQFVKEANLQGEERYWHEYDTGAEVFQYFRMDDGRSGKATTPGSTDADYGFVWYSVISGPGCGGFDGGISQLFRVTSLDPIHLERQDAPGGESLGAGRLHALFDSNGDGRPEYVIESSYNEAIELLDEFAQIQRSFVPHYWSCPC